MNDDISMQTGEYVNLYFQKASAGRRILATVIDWIMLAALLYLYFQFHYLFEYVFGQYASYLVCIFLSSVCMFTEFFSKGYTVGKFVMGIRLISDQCTPPSFLQCFLRWLLFPIDFWLLVGIFLLVSRGQRLGDMAAGVQCIYKNEQGQRDVDLRNDFPYVDDDYKVLFPDVVKLDANTIKSVELLLFRQSYRISKDELCKKLRQVLVIENRISDSLLLQTVYNDYRYLQIHKAGNA